MDRDQEEMQFLGFFGIIREPFNIIRSRPKIFASIFLALIVPLASVFLFYIGAYEVLFITNEQALDRSVGTPRYEKLSLSDILSKIITNERSPGTRMFEKLVSYVLSKEWTVFLLFKLAYLTFLHVLFHLSTSAVVHTVACVYTSRDITFLKVLSVVPRVWGSLVATFTCSSVMGALYNAFTITMFTVCILALDDTVTRGLIFVVLGILYFTGYVYVTIVGQLAFVVSVLEEDDGIKAMFKTKELIKGNVGVSMIIFFMLNVFFRSLQILIENNVVLQGSSFGAPAKVGYGILCLVFLSGLFLYGLIIQTVIYFVCKSYHHEKMDKSA